MGVILLLGADAPLYELVHPSEGHSALIYVKKTNPKYFIKNVKGEKQRFPKLQGVRLTFVMKTHFLRFYCF